MCVFSPVILWQKLLVVFQQPFCPSLSCFLVKSVPIPVGPWALGCWTPPQGWIRLFWANHVWSYSLCKSFVRHVFMSLPVAISGNKKWCARGWLRKIFLANRHKGENSESDAGNRCSQLRIRRGHILTYSEIGSEWKGDTKVLDNAGWAAELSDSRTACTRIYVNRISPFFF